MRGFRTGEFKPELIVPADSHPISFLGRNPDCYAGIAGTASGQRQQNNSFSYFFSLPVPLLDMGH
jgi:hypothetical protein